MEEFAKDYDVTGLGDIILIRVAAAIMRMYEKANVS